jgi:hypothetical protein
LKTVLLITNSRRHQLLYEPGLKKYFAVDFRKGEKGEKGATAKIDAVVYDMPDSHTTIDLRWLAAVEVPLVLLTPEDELQSLSGPKRKVLVYPVRVNQIIRALWELGVKPEGGGLVR